ncbi:hypothetical protein SCLCIDRAFT_1221376 [Scleroderma citrinum Foug A]|uniref:Uncharacterized protein n=1 Tax=Scleroderma citrinum Foug A TaxID=1036808 RepID=A0A0C3DFI2_9AGAM|nr:hypothetical protein SCLCIDRAFT_1221376 [Scleroderma citrinum Foug A]
MVTLFSQACQWNSGTQFVIRGINNVGLERHGGWFVWGITLLHESAPHIAKHAW